MSRLFLLLLGCSANVSVVLNFSRFGVFLFVLAKEVWERAVIYAGRWVTVLAISAIFMSPYRLTIYNLLSTQIRKNTFILLVLPPQ